MRTVSTTLAALAFALVTAAGCSDQGGGSGGASPSPSATTATAAGCPVGSWRSTQVATQASAGDARVTISGGGGTLVTIAPNGAVRADFAGMQPANYTARLGNAQVKGDFFYRGTIDGSVQLPSPPSETGTWKPLQPLLREGTYRCDRDTLTITPSGSGANLTWTLTKA